MSELANTTVGANPPKKIPCASATFQWCATGKVPAVLTEDKILATMVDKGLLMPNGDKPNALWKVTVSLEHKGSDTKDCSTGAEVEFKSTASDACVGQNGINTDMNPGGDRTLGGATDDFDDPIPLTGLEIEIGAKSCVTIDASFIVQMGGVTSIETTLTGQTIVDDGTLSWSNNAPTCQININNSAVGSNIHPLATLGSNRQITLTFNGGTANGLVIVVPANAVVQSVPNPTSYSMSYACPTAPGGNSNVSFNSVTIGTVSTG